MSAADEVLQSMKSMMAQAELAGLKLQLPPNSMKTLNVEFIGVEMGKSLTAKVPFNPQHTNPLGMMQGGFVAAAIDDILGPLTYMTAQKPMVTIEMSTSFIRPITAKNSWIIIHGEVVSFTKSLMILKAEVRSQDGKLLATATQHALAAGS